MPSLAIAACRASARRPHLRAAVFVRVVARRVRSDESVPVSVPRLPASLLQPLDCSGLSVPSSVLWEQAQPGWRSAADTQRAEANVKREGMGNPELARDSRR